MGTVLHSLAITSRACPTCALLVTKTGRPDFVRGEGGVRGLRWFRIAPPEPPHPTFSPKGRRSETLCVPKQANSFLGGEGLDQLASGRVDLRMLAPPLHRDFLELDVAFPVVGDHGAHP